MARQQRAPWFTELEPLKATGFKFKGTRYGRVHQDDGTSIVVRPALGFSPIPELREYQGEIRRFQYKRKVEGEERQVTTGVFFVDADAMELGCDEFMEIPPQQTAIVSWRRSDDGKRVIGRYEDEDNGLIIVPVLRTWSKGLEPEAGVEDSVVLRYRPPFNKLLAFRAPEGLSLESADAGTAIAIAPRSDVLDEYELCRFLSEDRSRWLHVVNDYWRPRAPLAQLTIAACAEMYKAKLVRVHPDANPDGDPSLLNAKARRAKFMYDRLREIVHVLGQGKCAERVVLPGQEYCEKKRHDARALFCEEHRPRVEAEEQN